MEAVSGKWVGREIYSAQAILIGSSARPATEKSNKDYTKSLLDARRFRNFMRNDL
jgi:hypothetical protein